MSKEYGSAEYNSLFEAVSKHMKWDHSKTDLWFNTNNPLIGESTPRHYYCRRPEKCERWILSLIDENTVTNMQGKGE